MVETTSRTRLFMFIGSVLRKSQELARASRSGCCFVFFVFFEFPFQVRFIQMGETDYVTNLTGFSNNFWDKGNIFCLLMGV